MLCIEFDQEATITDLTRQTTQKLKVNVDDDDDNRTLCKKVTVTVKCMSQDLLGTFCTNTQRSILV